MWKLRSHIWVGGVYRAQIPQLENKKGQPRCHRNAWGKVVPAPEGQGLGGLGTSYRASLISQKVCVPSLHSPGFPVFLFFKMLAYLSGVKRNQKLLVVVSFVFSLSFRKREMWVSWMARLYGD